MKKHILLVDCNMNGLRAVDRALDRGYEVTLLEPNEPSWYVDNDINRNALSKLRSHVRVSANAMGEAAMQVHAAHPVDAVIWLFERSARIASKIAEQIGARAPKLASVEASIDKLAARQRLTKAGLNSLMFAQVASLRETRFALETIGYPAIIKPTSGAGSAFCAKLEDDSDIVRFWSGIDASFSASERFGQSFLKAARQSFLCEQYVTGPMVSAEVAACAGKFETLMISGRRRSRSNELVEYRIDMPADLHEVDADACASYAKCCVDALGLGNGVFHVELIVGPSGPICVEVNPRLMGGYMPLLFNQVVPVNIYDVLFDIHVEGRLTSMPSYTREYGATVRLESTANSLFDGAAFRSLLDVRRSEFRMVEVSDAVSYAESVRVGDVLARLQLAATTSEDREKIVDQLLDDIERETGASLLR